MKTQLICDFLTQHKLTFLMNEPMSRHTTFKVGGNAAFLVTAESADNVIAIFEFCKQNDIPLTLLGKGSNVLVSDEGIDGIVLKLSEQPNISVAPDGTICCNAGMSLTALCATALENGLSGLEFAYGIPGSVGGAVFMNAGAYGGEIKDVIVSATALYNGEIKEINAENMALGYRTSVFKTNGHIILSAKFKLVADEKEKIKARMTDFITRRRDKQPLDFPSAGSTFKRPEGYFAGVLIEQNGLKGYSIGGAEVSEKHAGFVINKSNATSRDIKQLIKHIQDTVYKNNGVKLEREVIYLGRGEN
ncbi:MAG: UDP-N-acetylmuramate dehydrogenase [Ruminococcaceae bacterium]|nr:UDP-N-acetylmuramate dehydrogenase [Oscillospiraceae bacterium]